MKTLIFEGAGMSKADTSIESGVGNCRIRTRIKNNEGRIIYLEMGGCKVSKKCATYQKGFNIASHIDHLFYTDSKWDANRSHSATLSNLTRIYFEYNKENILKYVNENLNCSFDSLEVINDNSVRAHDTEEPLCDCSIENCVSYQNIEININQLDSVRPVYKPDRARLAKYKLGYMAISNIENLKELMDRNTNERDKEKLTNIDIYFRWDADDIINSLEIQGAFGCMGLGSEDVQNVIDLMIQENKMAVAI